MGKGFSSQNKLGKKLGKKSEALCYKGIFARYSGRSLHKRNVKPCTPVQPAEVRANQVLARALAWKGSDIQDAGKPSESVGQGFTLRLG